MSTVIDQDDETRLRNLLLQSLDPVWTNVVMNWIRRFDGWYMQEREENRNPQAAIAYECLRRKAIRQGVARTTKHLAHLPFSRWAAVAIFNETQWDPVAETFAAFAARNKDQGVYAFPTPDVSPRRLHGISAYLRTMYELERIKQKHLDPGALRDD